MLRISIVVWRLASEKETTCWAKLTRRTECGTSETNHVENFHYNLERQHQGGNNLLGKGQQEKEPHSL